MYTIEHCEKMIKLCNDAEVAILSGKRYRIGTRELERANLSEIHSIRFKWEQELQKLQSGGKIRRAKRVIPRDF